jgi:hypothetical protein
MISNNAIVMIGKHTANSIFNTVGMFDPTAKPQSAVLQFCVISETSLFVVQVCHLNLVFLFLHHGGKLLHWIGTWIFWVSMIHKEMVVPCKLDYITLVLGPLTWCCPTMLTDDKLAFFTFISVITFTINVINASALDEVTSFRRALVPKHTCRRSQLSMESAFTPSLVHVKCTVTRSGTMVLETDFQCHRASDTLNSFVICVPFSESVLTGKTSGAAKDSASALWTLQKAHQTKKLPDPSGKRSIFIDNFYTRHNLAEKVKVMTDGEIHITGTCRLDVINARNKVGVKKGIDMLKDRPRGSWALVRAFNPPVDDYHCWKEGSISRMVVAVPYTTVVY